MRRQFPRNAEVARLLGEGKQFGFSVENVTLDEAVYDLTRLMRSGESHHVSFLNAHYVNVASRRRVLTVVKDKTVVHELFTEIAPRYANRNGGYTRIVKVGPRRGDNAELAILELVDGTASPKVKDSAKRKRARRILKAEERAEEKAALLEAAEETKAEAAEEVVEETDEAPAEVEAADEEEEKKED